VRSAPSAERLRHRGIRLEWLTIAWNSLEVVVTVGLGVQARSLALVAFGLDSIIEIFASAVVVGNLRDERRDPGDRRVHRALRRIAVAFWLLAAFLLVVSVQSLAVGRRPGSSALGIAYMALAAVAMFALAAAKRLTASRSGSETLAAEATMTLLDGCLATGVLVALAVNTLFGWWWADAGAALVVAGFAVREGVDQWRSSAPHDAP
jgi:divalent metal cation (Fe/Co/Zn/Cd) transporter